MGIMLQIISFSIALAARINFMRHEIEQKKLDNEQLNQRLLRTQMNPHFIFNSLTSIQNYLFENEPQKTALYLSKFSKLMRQILESSRGDFIPLSKEIQTLENYLQLQKMRFGEKLNFEIKVEPDIDPEEVQIPPMFAQPFLENSIEHGILHRSQGGFILIEFKQAENMIILNVEDNGVGLSQSQTLRSEIKKEYKSLATQITQERLSLLRQKYQLPLDFIIEELKNQFNEVKGTHVQVKLPFQI
jgi:sensor histidine kinase YesM